MGTEPVWPPLPAKLSTDPLLTAFTQALQDAVAPSRQELDALPRYLSAARAPQAWLQWLCAAFGLRTEPDWDTARLRAVVREGPLLNATRGTAVALCREALLVHGCVLGLADPGRVEMSSALRPMSSLTQERILQVWARATDVQVPTLQRLVEAHCPAWLPYNLELTTGKTLPAQDLPLKDVDGALVGPGGEVYVWQEDPGTDGFTVWLVDPVTGTGACLVGAGPQANSQDEEAGEGKPGPEARITYVRGGAVDAEGQVILATGERLRTIDTMGILTSLPTLALKLKLPRGVVVHPDGTLFVADGQTCAVYALDPRSGTTRTVAGIPDSPGHSGDRGPAEKAQLNAPHHLALDATGRILYIADTDNHRVRAVNLHSRIINTVAGTGTAGFDRQADKAVQAPLNKPWSVTVSADGSVFFSDRGNHCVRKVTPDGQLRTVAGTPGKEKDDGDGGQATDACLNRPAGVSIDAGRNVLYIADSGRSGEPHSPGRVRQVDLTRGTITAFAGSPARGTTHRTRPTTESPDD
ncbi:phage tail protein [Streptomyces sp. NPDC057743]|uniref:phage tail protein n=1 Tax=Streptomyces sp. NPDC057743 TaxID=3346236 RepID=UPI00369839EE